MSDSWLYAKPDSTVRIVRTGTLSVDVRGPGLARHCYSFTDDTQLVAFLDETEERLTSSGFRPKGYGTDRRLRADRRHHPRIGERRTELL